jgi:small subunit ribosomal protein S8
MVGDKISNLIISLKNAYTAGHTVVSLPYTKMSESILTVLRREGFVQDFDVKGKELKKSLSVSLRYENGLPAITEVKRISKQSKRVYIANKDIRPIKQGYGISVISTPKGIMSDKEARDKKVGGESLFKVW